MFHEDSKKFFQEFVSPKMMEFLEAMKTLGEKEEIPNISWNTAQYITETLLAFKPKNILEIGPANGFSTMIMSLSGARITSIEFSRHAFEELRYNLQSFQTILDNPLEEIRMPALFGPKVTSSVHQENIGPFTVYFADARELLPAFIDGKKEVYCTHPASTLCDVPQQSFDIIFIDGAFRMTREFYDLSLPLLSDNGVVIVDDAIKYRWKMGGFHEYLESLGTPYELIQTDEDDGIMIIR